MHFPTPIYQKLSSTDKSCIYDWLRQAADSEVSADAIARVIQEAASRAGCPQDFDELMLKAMSRKLPSERERPVGLESLSYSSTAVSIPTAQQLQHLLDRARDRNLRESVTGVLLYSEGSFHQYLEGPPAGIDHVYAAIRRDPLHHHIFELLREPIEVREFQSWAMGYRGTARIDGTFEEVALTALLADESAKIPGGRLLLNAFWNQGMGTRYRAAIDCRRKPAS